ncbi:hypothetical protein GGRV_ORF69R [German gecko ranavirus]|uniref:Uncharacterized protein n=1 Tax=German gecko ranavirus TaxID=1620702 RepID=A0A0D3R3A3_FRG3V|nr:hypothetical protein GGRV_ORF69R [German gecko ranavirus]
MCLQKRGAYHFSTLTLLQTLSGVYRPSRWQPSDQPRPRTRCPLPGSLPTALSGQESRRVPLTLLLVVCPFFLYVRSNGRVFFINRDIPVEIISMSTRMCRPSLDYIPHSTFLRYPSMSLMVYGTSMSFIPSF